MKKRLLNPRRLLLGTLLLGGLIVGLIFLASHACQQMTAGRIYNQIATVPTNDVGLVLGAARLTKGRPNLHFNLRIQAAAALYHAGKVRHLLVSGDNHIASYDEPTDMRNALVAAGVPDSAITCDYAGFRTLDSVVRAQKVFSLEHCTIITEAFHCPRAVWIAREHGLDAVAFAAPNVTRKRWAWRANIREQFARTWCAVDLYVLHRAPHFTGPKEPIYLTAVTR